MLLNNSSHYANPSFIQRIKKKPSLSGSEQISVGRCAREMKDTWVDIYIYILFLYCICVSVAFSEIKFHFLPLHCMRIYSINNLMSVQWKLWHFADPEKKEKKKKEKFRHMQSDPFMFLTCANLAPQLTSRGFREVFNEMMVFQFVFVFWPRHCLATAAEKQSVGRESGPHIIYHWLDIIDDFDRPLVVDCWTGEKRSLPAPMISGRALSKIKFRNLKNHTLDTACHHHMWSGPAFYNTFHWNYRLSNPNLNHRLGARLLLSSPWLRKWIHHYKMAVLKWLRRCIWTPVAIYPLVIAILIDLIEYITPVRIPQDSVYFCF